MTPWQAKALDFWPAALATALMGAWFGVYALLALGETAGEWVYSFDDAYIHLAMARNLARHGVYGVSPVEFTSSSSSPAWVLLLALSMLVFGAKAWLALAFNLIFSLGLIVAAERLLARFGVPRPARAAMVLAIGLAMPLVPMVATGMEHVLHGLVCVGLIALTLSVLGAAPSRAARLGLVALAALAPMVRYESMFLLAGVVAALLLWRRWRLALAVGAAAVLPVLIYAAIALLQDWPPVPYSIYLKSGLHEALLNDSLTVPGLALAFTKGVARRLLLTDWPIAVLGLFGFGLLLGQLWRRGGLGDLACLPLLLMLPTGWLHLGLVRTDVSGRYDSYLIVAVMLGVLILAWHRLETWRGWLGARLGRASGVVFALAIALPLAPAMGRADLTRSFSLPWVQSVEQSSLFVARFAAERFPGGKIVVMELGAVAWAGDFQIIDLFGLGSARIARLAWHQRYNKGAAVVAAEGFDLAIVFDAWYVNFFKSTPPPWVKIASVRAANNQGGAIDLYVRDRPAATRIYGPLAKFIEQNGHRGAVIWAPQTVD